MNKQDVLQLIGDQPEDMDIDAFIYTLWFRRKIELALASPEEDDVSLEEIDAMIDSWPE